MQIYVVIALLNKVFSIEDKITEIVPKNNRPLTPFCLRVSLRRQQAVRRPRRQERNPEVGGKRRGRRITKIRKIGDPSPTLIPPKPECLWSGMAIRSNKCSVSNSSGRKGDILRASDTSINLKDRIVYKFLWISMSFRILF